MKKIVSAFIIWLLFASSAFAQGIGAAKDITVPSGSGSTAFQLTGPLFTYPSLLITPATGTSTEIRWAAGASSAVLASATSPVLPPGGMCYAEGTSNQYISFYGATASATVHITQVTVCPPGIGFAAGGGGSTGGSASVGTIGQVAPGSADYTGMLLNPGGTLVGATGSPWGTAPSGNVLGANVNVLANVLATNAANAVNQTATQSAPGVATTTLDNVQGNLNGTPVPVSGFKPTPAYVSLPVAAASNRVALPSNPPNTTIVVENMGSNPACVLLGGSAVVATSSGTLCTASDFIPANSSVPYAVGANTFIAAIQTSVGATSLMISGGSGLFTGAGGGGGTTGTGSNASVGSIGSVPPLSGTYMGMLVSGNMVGMGGSAWGSVPTGNVLGTNTNVLSSVLPAGAATSSNQPAINADLGAQVHVMNFPATQNIAGTVSCSNCAAGGGGGGAGSGGSTPQTTSSRSVSVPTLSTAIVIPNSPGLLTYITKEVLVAAGNGNFYIEYGTGTNCSVSPVILEGALPAVAQFGIVEGTGFGTVYLPIPAGSDVCVVNNNAAAVTGSIAFTQSAGTIGSFGGPVATTGFQPSASGSRMAQLSVSAVDSSGPLPTGPETVVENTDTTNPVYCNVLGVAATTSDKKIPANSWFSFMIPSGVTALHCIAPTGTVLVNGTGGSGLATGAGGGGGGGGVTTPLPADASTFTYGASPMTPIGCVFNSSTVNLTTAQQGVVGCTNNRNMLIDVLTSSNLYAALTSGVVTIGSPILTAGVQTAGKDINGNSQAMQVNPCAFASSFVDVVTTTGTGTLVITGVTGKIIYICGVLETNSATINWSLVEGTGPTCTPPANVMGNNPSSVTAANGMTLAAGFTKGDTDKTIAKTAITGDNLCELFTTTGTPQVNLHVSYVIQ